VIKGQVHVGGRGKSGAIKVAQNEDELKTEADCILGMDVKGLTVEKVLIEQAIDIAKEYYLGIILDRTLRDNVIMISAMGGVDIEEVAESQPEAILKLAMGQKQSITDAQVKDIVDFLQLDAGIVEAFRDMLHKLIKTYFVNDAQLAEINPLVLTGDNQWIACDGKILIDDNALFRQKSLKELEDEAEDNELEREAHKQGIAYVKLDGNVGIIGNGAGLVMTTMDEVNRAGGAPANFLDIGGGAKKEMMEKCLKVLYSDKQVEGIFINIFGGITRCDEVANGLVEVIQNAPRQLPIVLRLSGTRAEEGRAIVEGHENLISAETMSDGAQKIVEAMQS
jgi:succinyl-CoA synthetase beta subunit